MKVQKVLSVLLISTAMIVTAFSVHKKVKVSADNPVYVFIGTYTQKEPHVDGKAEGFYIYEMNLTSGELTHFATSPFLINPSYLAVSPEGKYVYAVNETGEGKISAYKVDKEKKQIELINSVSSQGNSPCYISFDKTGKFIMVANYGSGTVALYPVNNDGSLAEATFTGKHEGKGPTDRQTSPHAHMIRTGINNPFVYAVDLGTDEVITYKLDTKNKLLVKTQAYKSKPGAGPRHIDFHPNSKWAYVVNELNGTIEACNVDAKTGALTNFQAISTRPAGETRFAGCADIHISPSGKFLYATNRGEINNIAMFSVDEKSGKLKAIGHQPVKGKTPRSFAIDPSGKFLLVANQDSDNMVVFEINASDGKLTDTGIEARVPTPVCVKFE